MTIEKEVISKVVNHGERIDRLETLEFGGGGPHQTLLAQVNVTPAALLARVKLLPGTGYTYTVNAWGLGADQSGSVAIQIWMDTDANYPPTVADLIGTITITGDDHASGTPAGWTTDQIPHGNWLFFYCTTATDIEIVTLALELI